MFHICSCNERDGEDSGKIVDSQCLSYLPCKQVQCRSRGEFSRDLFSTYMWCTATRVCDRRCFRDRIIRRGCKASVGIDRGWFSWNQFSVLFGKVIISRSSCGQAKACWLSDIFTVLLYVARCNVNNEKFLLQRWRSGFGMLWRRRCGYRRYTRYLFRKFSSNYLAT